MSCGFTIKRKPRNQSHAIKNNCNNFGHNSIAPRHRWLRLAGSSSHPHHTTVTLISLLQFLAFVCRRDSQEQQRKRRGSGPLKKRCSTTEVHARSPPTTAVKATCAVSVPKSRLTE
eukprot:Selendium_serpulae@DN5933_c1_g1_i17.p2